LGCLRNFYWNDLRLGSVCSFVSFVRYLNLAAVLTLDLHWGIYSSLGLAHDDSFRREASLIDKLILALNKILGYDDLLWFLFFIECSLVLTMLNFVKLRMLWGSLCVCFLNTLHFLLAQVEIVDDISDVGHRLGFDCLRLE
jgi:hypothetical protein